VELSIDAIGGQQVGRRGISSKDELLTEEVKIIIF